MNRAFRPILLSFIYLSPIPYTEYPTDGQDIAETIFNDDAVHDWVF